MVFNSTRYYTVISSYKRLHEVQGKTSLPVPGMITKVTFLNGKIKSIMKDPRVTVLIHDDSITPYHRNPQTQSNKHSSMWSPGIVSCFAFLMMIFFTFAFSLLNLLQFSSVTQSCPTLCDPLDCSQTSQSIINSQRTHVHRVSDAIQPSYPLSSPSPPAFNLSQHQDLFKWVSSSHQVAKVLELPLQHQSFQWIFRTDLL